MKKILLVLLFVAIATSADIPWLCGGYYNEQACFKTSMNSYCASQTDYSVCDKCINDYFKLSTSASSCEFDEEKYEQADLVKSWKTNADVEHLNHWYNAYLYSAYQTFDINKISCAVEGTIIPEGCQVGYYFNTSTFRCVQCTNPTICLACTSDQATDCTLCETGYFQNSDGSCAASKCDENATKCSDATTASACDSGYYLDSGKCVQCTDVNSLCKAQDSITSCKTGYYLTTESEESETKVCKACNDGSNNIRQCEGAPEDGKNTNIIECSEPDTSNFYYLTSEGCKAHARTYMCKTIQYNSNDEIWECSSCFTNYTNIGGQCRYNCDADQYFDKNSQVGTYRSCRDCGDACTACTQTVDTSATTYVATVTCSNYDATRCTDNSQAAKTIYADQVTTNTFSGTATIECESVSNDDTEPEYKCTEYEVNAVVAGAETMCTACKDDYSFEQAYTDATLTTAPDYTNFRCVDPNDDTPSTNDYYCKKYRKNGTTISCEECFTELDGTYVATITTGTVITCAPVVEDKGPQVIAIENCAHFKRGGDGTIECQECDSGYVLMTKYSDITTNAFNTKKDQPKVCVADSVAGNCTKIDQNSADPVDTRCSEDTECDSGYQILKTYTSTTVTGTTYGTDYVITCPAEDHITTSNSGRYCKSVIKNSDASVVYCDVDECSSAQETKYYKYVGSTKYLDRCDADQDSGAAAFCTVVNIASDDTMSCDSTTECTSSKVFVEIHGTNSDNSFSGTPVSYMCAAVDGTGTDADDCDRVKVSGNFLDGNGDAQSIADATEKQCLDDSTCATGTNAPQQQWTSGFAAHKDPFIKCIAKTLDATIERTDDDGSTTEIAPEATCTGGKIWTNTYAGSTFTGAETITCAAADAYDSGHDDIIDCAKVEIDNDSSERCIESAGCVSGFKQYTKYANSDYTGSTIKICRTEYTDTGNCSQAVFNDSYTAKCLETTECNSSYYKHILYSDTVSEQYNTLDEVTCVADGSQPSDADDCTAYKINDASTSTGECLDGCLNNKIFSQIYKGYGVTGTEDTTKNACVTSTSTLYTPDEKNLCTAVTVTVGDTETTYECTDCLDPAWLSSGRCYPVPLTGCAEAGSTQSKCGKCQSGYVLKTDGTECFSCATVANCKTYKAGDTACECELCNDNAYFDENNNCKTTVLPNCLEMADEMGTDPDCIICYMGYSWDSTAKECKLCNDTDNVCKQTGCKAAYTTSSSSSSGSNSTIIAFVLSALLAFLTVLL